MEYLAGVIFWHSEGKGSVVKHMKSFLFLHLQITFFLWKLNGHYVGRAINVYNQYKTGKAKIICNVFLVDKNDFNSILKSETCHSAFSTICLSENVLFFVKLLLPTRSPHLEHVKRFSSLRQPFDQTFKIIFYSANGKMFFSI